jgi:hypothetical protein
MMCGGFVESNRRILQLEDMDGALFGKVIDLWCGKEAGLQMELSSSSLPRETAGTG